MLKILGVFIILLWTVSAHGMGYSNLKKYSYYNRKQIHKLPINNNIVYKLNTAFGFISVITLPTIPLDVVIGDSNAFSYYTLGSQIFVRPKSYNKKVSTNMEILTKFGLINIEIEITSKKDVAYDLDLAKPGQSFFYKNYIEHKLRKLENKLKMQYTAKYKTIAAMKQKVAQNKIYVEKLILSINKEKINASANKHNISFTAIYKSKIGNKYYIRYMISNSTNNYVIVHDLYLYDSSSAWYGASSKKEVRILNPVLNLKLMPREVYKGYIVYNDKNANDLSMHLYVNGKLTIIKVKL